MSRVSVAIDGPAASGKGTLARTLAERFDFAYLDTGSLYRAVALRVLETDADPSNAGSVVELAQNLRTEDFNSVEGCPSDLLLRSEDVGNLASVVAALAPVRSALLAFQQAFAETPPGGKAGAILDGRDIGTVVLPNADLKLYVTATPEERARRRWLELKERSEAEPDYDTCLLDIHKRDERDMQRASAPLRPADDAIHLDTTELSATEALNVASEKLQGVINVLRGARTSQ